MIAERQRSGHGLPSPTDSLPPSYEDVRGNGVPPNASSDSGPKMPEKISYFLAEVLNNSVCYYFLLVVWTHKQTFA